MPQVPIHEAYPELSFRWRSANWLSRLIGLAAECQHLESHSPWMATFLPDNLYLRGRNVNLREPRRPEVSLCRECFAKVFEKEVAAYGGRVVAFEPDADAVTQCFFVAQEDCDAAGVEPALVQAIGAKLGTFDDSKRCLECRRGATWLWFSRAQVPHLDATEELRRATGEYFCAEHGAQKICGALTGAAQANLYYVNAPYGEAGAYLSF